MAALLEPADVDRILIAEGHAPADIAAVFDSLIAAGLEQPNDRNAITAAELDLMRDQLNAPDPD